MSATLEAKAPLEDGLYCFPGKPKRFMYVKEGVMWLPADLVHPLVALTMGKTMLGVDGKFFVRSGDLMEEMPKYRKRIQEIADEHGLKV